MGRGEDGRAQTLARELLLAGGGGDGYGGLGAGATRRGGDGAHTGHHRRSRGPSQGGRHLLPHHHQVRLCLPALLASSSPNRVDLVPGSAAAPGRVLRGSKSFFPDVFFPAVLAVVPGREECAWPPARCRGAASLAWRWIWRRSGLGVPF